MTHPPLSVVMKTTAQMGGKRIQCCLDLSMIIGECIIIIFFFFNIEMILFNSTIAFFFFLDIRV